MRAALRAIPAYGMGAIKLMQELSPGVIDLIPTRERLLQRRRRLFQQCAEWARWGEDKDEEAGVPLLHEPLSKRELAAARTTRHWWPEVWVRKYGPRWGIGLATLWEVASDELRDDMRYYLNAMRLPAFKSSVAVHAALKEMSTFMVQAGKVLHSDTWPGLIYWQGLGGFNVPSPDDALVESVEELLNGDVVSMACGPDGQWRSEWYLPMVLGEVEHLVARSVNSIGDWNVEEVVNDGLWGGPGASTITTLKVVTRDGKVVKARKTKAAAMYQMRPSFVLDALRGYHLRPRYRAEYELQREMVADTKLTRVLRKPEITWKVHQRVLMLLPQWEMLVDSVLYNGVSKALHGMSNCWAYMAGTERLEATLMRAQNAHTGERVVADFDQSKFDSSKSRALQSSVMEVVLRHVSGVLMGSRRGLFDALSVQSVRFLREGKVLIEVMANRQRVRLKWDTSLILSGGQWTSLVGSMCNYGEVMAAAKSAHNAWGVPLHVVVPDILLVMGDDSEGQWKRPSGAVLTYKAMEYMGVNVKAQQLQVGMGEGEFLQQAATPHFMGVKSTRCVSGFIARMLTKLVMGSVDNSGLVNAERPGEGKMVGMMSRLSSLAARVGVRGNAVRETRWWKWAMQDVAYANGVSRAKIAACLETPRAYGGMGCFTGRGEVGMSVYETIERIEFESVVEPIPWVEEVGGRWEEVSEGRVTKADVRTWAVRKLSIPQANEVVRVGRFAPVSMRPGLRRKLDRSGPLFSIQIQFRDDVPKPFASEVLTHILEQGGREAVFDALSLLTAKSQMGLETMFRMLSWKAFLWVVAGKHRRPPFALGVNSELVGVVYDHWLGRYMSWLVTRFGRRRNATTVSDLRRVMHAAESACMAEVLQSEWYIGS